MTAKYLESCEGTQPAHYLRSLKGTGQILVPWEHDLQMKVLLHHQIIFHFFYNTIFSFLNRFPCNVNLNEIDLF